MTSEPPYPGTQAVRRALALLKQFDDGQPERGLSDLARGAGLNKTTTFRLLSALEQEGLVSKSANGETYRLGAFAITLGARAMRSNSLYAASRVELEALAAQTGETATLEILAGSETLILDEVRGQFLVGATPEIGTRWHAHTTSTGKAILAHLDPRALQLALPRRLVPLTKKSITDRRRLLVELERIKRQGFAVAVEEVEEGFVAIGAPIFDHTGSVVAAISLGGPKARFTQDRIKKLGKLLIESSQRISERLGYRETRNEKREP
jgi:DNA-binding IclR family transcriptional regulator